MKPSVCPELSTASVGSSQAPTAAVDNSAPFANHPASTYKSGKVVQTNGATSTSSFASTPPIISLGSLCMISLPLYQRTLNCEPRYCSYPRL